MKLAAVFLCVLGVVAALCAAFLVNAMRLPSVEVRMPAKPDDSQEIQVLFANRLIPAMTVVDARWVTAKMMPKNKVPKDYTTSTVNVVGKIAAIPIVEGQTFTANCFAESTPPRLVAEAIPHGKRAVGISVSDYGGLEGMLYPGSTVDVLATFKKDTSDERDSVTTTLLENVQVLGIEQQTIVSANKPGATENINSSRGGTRRVTLLVDTQQAKALRVAMENGTLALALRNPMDAGKANREAVSARGLLGGETNLSEFAKFMAEAMKAGAAARAAAPQVVASKDPFANTPPSEPTTKPAETPRWNVEIIRGQSIETKSFEMPKADQPAVPAKTDPSAKPTVAGKIESDGL